MAEISKLTDLVAVVTGAGRGIGEHIARSFDAEGATVVVSDVTGEQDRVAAELSNGGLALHADVSSDHDVQALIERTVAEFGRIDVLCNNAGIDGEMKPLIETSLKEFEHVLDVNLRGVFLGLRHAVPAMIAAGGGSIINIASIAGMVGFEGSSAYAASKAGVLGLTRVAAVEYGPAKVRVNAICPGVIETPMLRELEHHAPDVHRQIVAHGESMSAVKRLGQPGEIATLAVFLASRDSSFLTGAAIPVDGGYIAM